MQPSFLPYILHSRFFLYRCLWARGFMALSDDFSVRKHSYAALEGPEHIRLIALHPALSKDEPLRVNFLSSTLKDLEGRYEAISYTWGQPILTFALYVDDGTQVFVTENLDRALRYLRRHDRDRLLWADAASINQTDNAEKAEQIPLMVQIFRGAQRVIAWLDPGRDTTIEQNSMRKLDRLSRKPRFAKWENTEGRSEILSLFDLPWFNRLWIVQEIVFSLDICLICGDTELSFSRLLVALSVLKTESNQCDNAVADEARMHAILKISRLWNRHSFLDQYPKEVQADDTTQILSLVENFNSYGCTDPRDRIFALYSMATDVRSTGIPYHRGTGGFPAPKKISFDIDYSLDVRETYHTFARSCWKQEKVHEQMWQALLSRQHSPLQTDWSSWAPDWRVLPRPVWPQSPFTPPYGVIEECDAKSEILRMGFFYRGRTKDSGIGNLYSVHLKTSRTAPDNQTPLLFQLEQLHKSLQNHRRDMGGFSTLSQKLRARLGHNTLLNMAKVLTPFHPGWSDSMVNLGQYFSTMETASEGSDSNCNAISVPPVQVQNLIQALERELGDDELFCCQDPLTQVYSVGFGNKKVEINDKVVLLDDQTEHSTWDTPTRVLIIRQVDYLDDTLEPTFQLVGSGYLLDYTWFYLNQDLMRYWERDRDIHAEDPVMEELHRNFCLEDNHGFLNLV